jgi:heptosyltransferase II
MKIGVFLPHWIGDVAMATPTLRALRRYAGNGSTLIGIMRPHVAPVLEGTTWLDERWFYDPEAADRGIRFPAVTVRMYKARLDAAVLLTNTRLPAIMSWLARARRRVGYVRNRRGAFLTHKLHPRVEHGRFVPCSTLDYYLDLAYAIGCPEESPRIELATTAEDEHAADGVWNTLGLKADGRVVAFSSSGAFGVAKLWPDEYFSELARRIVQDLDGQVLVLCGPAERDRARGIAARAGLPGVVSLADQQLSIGLSKACVRRSRLLVSTDSGPRHFAAAFNIRAVSLFGPTHPAWGDNHYAGDTILRIPVDCGPCQQRTCPLGHHKCMRDLTVDEVYDAVLKSMKNLLG